MKEKYKGFQTIHLWSKGKEKYLGNIILNKPFIRITEERLNEIVNTFPNKDQVEFCTFE